MLRFSPGQPTVPFIASQRLFHLHAPEHLKRKCMEPEAFSQARLARKENDESSLGDQGLPADCSWQQVEDREAFLMNMNHRRLCLTIDAGIGKTSAMMQIQYLRGCCLPGHLVIGEQFDNLPDSANEYVEGGWLLSRLRQDLPTGSDEQLRRLLMRKIQQGQVTLLVDALDQITMIRGSEERALQRASALADFLTGLHAEKIHCVVAGRPPAVHRYWNKLVQPTSPWEFAQIDLFSQEERERFLGPERAEVLERVDADVVAVPRMLETLRRIRTECLTELKTASDIYWHVVDDMLGTDIRDQADVLKREPALFYFALLAFESLKQGFLNGVPPKQMESFRRKILDDRLHQLARWREKTIESYDLKEDLRQLGNLNTVIEYGVLDSAESLTHAVFRDRTLLDFFAALWVTNFVTSVGTKILGADEIIAAVDDDIDWLGNHQFVRRGSGDKKQHEQFWRLATEMPASAINEESFAAAMSVLYESRLYSGSRSRSTEMIYRSWPTMLRLAGYIVPLHSYDADLISPTQKAQQDAWELVESTLGNMNHEECHRKTILRERLKLESKPAKRATMNFLTEYPGIYFGADGRASETIAHDFESWFVSVPEKVDAPLSFVGVDGEVQIDKPFLLAKSVVTNELFSLFDSGRTGGMRTQDPAIQLDWYDAWTTGLYFHGRLPNEDEWEYAFRASPRKVDQTWNWCSDVPGSVDMESKVWEWTASFYHEDRKQSRETTFSSWLRVLCGGSFFTCGVDFQRIRCGASRLPMYSVHGSGVRVARAQES